MRKLTKSKKAQNDVSFIILIVTVFILVGTFLPFVNESFNNSVTTFNTEGLVTNTDDQINTDKVSATTVFFSIFSMFFWSFGALPIFLEIFFIIMRIILGVLIYRNVRSGGG